MNLEDELKRAEQELKQTQERIQNIREEMERKSPATLTENMIGIFTCEYTSGEPRLVINSNLGAIVLGVNSLNEGPFLASAYTSPPGFPAKEFHTGLDYIIKNYENFRKLDLAEFNGKFLEFLKSL